MRLIANCWSVCILPLIILITFYNIYLLMAIANTSATMTQDNDRSIYAFWQAMNHGDDGLTTN